jgi:hypothetical protein
VKQLLITNEEGRPLPAKTFFDDRIERLEKYHKSCNPSIARLVKSSIEINCLLRDILVGEEKNSNQRQ